MAYTNYYYLHAAKRVQALAAPFLEEGYSLYWIWQNVQLPLFPISYSKFVEMMSESQLDNRIAKKELKRCNRFKVK